MRISSLKKLKVSLASNRLARVPPFILELFLKHQKEVVCVRVNIYERDQTTPVAELEIFIETKGGKFVDQRVLVAIEFHGYSTLLEFTAGRLVQLVTVFLLCREARAKASAGSRLACR